MENLQQAAGLVELHDDGVGELFRQAAVLPLKGALARQDDLDVLLVAALGAGVNQHVLPLLPGIAAHHQHVELPPHPVLLGGPAIGVLGADAVGDDVELGGVAVVPELVCDHVAGAVNVGEAVEEGVPELGVYEIVYPLAVAQVEGVGDVFRLAMEGRRVWNAQTFHVLEAHDGQGGRHHKVHHVRPGRRLFKDVPVGYRQAHPLAGDQVLHNGEELHLPDGVFIVRGLSRGDDPDLVPVFLQGGGKAAGADGGTIVGVVELVDDQDDFHRRCQRPQPWPRTCSSPRASWSGQEVLLGPQWMPLRRRMASPAGRPFTRAAMPWRLPLHPPVTRRDWMTPWSSRSTCISREQTPRGWKV